MGEARAGEGVHGSVAAAAGSGAGTSTGPVRYPAAPVLPALRREAVIDARGLRLIRRYNVPWWLLGMTRQSWPIYRPEHLGDYERAWCPV